MLTLSNGYSFDIACASGALAYGRGWWWERFVLIPLGAIRPAEFTIITKTITLEPRVGNLRTWCPWRCVRLLPGGGAVNAVGLTNPGMEWWRTTGYEDNVVRTGRHAIVSVQPADTTEATKMAHVLAGQSELKGVEINWSCPNVKQQTGPDLLADLVRSFRDNCPHPVGVKLADTACLRYCEAVDGEVEWFDLINTVPWSNLYPDRPSPLARLGGGGVSGPAISARSKYALRAVANNFQTPVISGGGIWSLDDARERFAMGAAAITIGTLFLSRPWRPTRIARQIRSGATAR